MPHKICVTGHAVAMTYIVVVDDHDSVIQKLRQATKSRRVAAVEATLVEMLDWKLRMAKTEALQVGPDHQLGWLPVGEVRTESTLPALPATGLEEERIILSEGH
jgi:hypothetical protein